MRTGAIIWILLVLFLAPLSAQGEADSTQTTAFRKGRNLVRMEGGISSSFLGNAADGGARIQNGNQYSYALNLGKLVSTKHLLALEFKITKEEMVGIINSSAETMAVGPFYRYYLGIEPAFAFYLQAGVSYASYHGTATSDRAFMLIDEYLDLQGIRGSMGFGLSYVMNDRACFEVGCIYGHSRLWGTYENLITREVHPTVLNHGSMAFTFGFSILFERLKR